MSEARNSEIASDRLPPSLEGEAAPGELELVRSFVNTRELDPDREELTDPPALAAWIEARGIAVRTPLDDRDLARAIAFREGLRALLLANSGAKLDPAAIEALRVAGREAPLEVQLGDDGLFATAPACDGLDAFIAAALAAAAAAQETGEWERLKACTADECLWAFYDRSRNRSRHWCSMDVCGNRAKTRAYRAKHSAG